MSPAKVFAGNGVHGGGIPVAFASHEDVVKDETLFMDTLRNFHHAFGSKYLVPVIGGKELNLHVLYMEVTKRGGYDKVVKEKKWREISAVFDFSPTTTSASYALRKHYFTLLHHYELVYFFRFQSSMPGHATSPSFQAIGTIDGKLDFGYLISVQLGDEIMNGVMYHQVYASPSALTPQPCTALMPYQLDRKIRRKRADPGRPKTNRSGYNFFFAEKHSYLKSLYPKREREFTKMIGQSWNNLSPEERIVYQNYGVKDKERYQKELKEYKERLKMAQHCLIPPHF